MRTIVTETDAYKFPELSDTAKDAAREWFRRDMDIDYGCVIDDAKEIAALFGIDIDKVYFSGFSSQGDGAMFIGSYRYKAGWKKALQAHVGGEQLPKLIAIGEALQRVQRGNMYQLTASMSHRGRYYHSNSMSISVDRDASNYQDMTSSAENDLCDALRDYADWIYRALEREYEFRMSDAAVDEDIAANEYEFTASGQII